jgi:hypothetical protein
MADKEQRLAHDVWRPPGVSAEKIDSQIVITLMKGENSPLVYCTRGGRMTGQMVMGAEGSGMMRIDNELRRAQLELRRSSGQMPKENTKTLEERVFMTPVPEKTDA